MIYVHLKETIGDYHIKRNPLQLTVIKISALAKARCGTLYNVLCGFPRALRPEATKLKVSSGSIAVSDDCQPDITKITTPRASTPDKTDAPTRVSSTQETSTSNPAALSGTSNNVLTIALSTSLVIAFLLITFLVCVVVYRSGKQARVASSTNPECCSPNDLIPANNSAHRYQEGPPLPPDRPPAYETIPPLKEGGAHGGHYQELDSSAIGGGYYVELNEDKGHLPENGVPGDPHEYFTIVPPRPECSQVSPARNRDSQYDYMEPISSIPMNGTTSLPSGVNPEQTTMFHK
eukprot:XP_011666858.1 PREDICTED: uncharacterized protein LOC105439493 [Strongylocentrotus purpuratus]